MTNRKIRFNKVHIYGGLLSLGLMALLTGDNLRPVPMASVPPKPSGIAINPDDWQSLVKAVNTRASQYGATVGYVIKDFKSGQVVYSNADLSFPSASLIKFPVLCAAFQAVEEGKLSLSMPVTLQRGDRKGGSGVLKLSPVGTVFTNRELLEAMIGRSDNTAADLIVRQLGYDYLQKTFTAFGLQDTVIRPEGFKLTSRHVHEDNMTSPRDMAFLLEKIYKRELVSPQASDQMLDILKHQHLRDRLPRFLPSGWEIAHKTGLLRKACHDVGIVFSPKGDYMICVLTSHDVTYRMAKRFIASFARITYDYYGRRQTASLAGQPAGHDVAPAPRDG
jgi:beta-lactamase class A